MSNLQYSNPTPKKPALKIVLVILALVLILGAVYEAWGKLIKPKIDPTANWQIYRSEEYGYEAKYPLDYQMEKMELTDFDWKNNPDFAAIFKEGIMFNIFKNGEKQGFLSLSVYDNPLKLSVREWYSWIYRNHPFLSEKKKYFNESFEDVIINGMPGVRSDSQDGHVNTQIYLVKGGQVFDISYLEKLGKNKGNREIFKTFLKTLKID